MLIIKKEQMEIFKTLLTQEFENKMLHHLSSVFPEQTIDLDDKELLQLIQTGINKSKKYAIEMESDICRYLESSVLHGWDFDENPNTAWAGEILQDQSISAREKMDKIAQVETDNSDQELKQTNTGKGAENGTQPYEKSDPPYNLSDGDSVTPPSPQPRDKKLGDSVVRCFEEITIGIRILIDEEAVANAPYHLNVLGDIQEGTTDANGILQARIRNNAPYGKLIVDNNGNKEKYNLEFGLDPFDTITGLQARLNNLDFYHGQIDGIRRQKTDSAIKSFNDRYECKSDNEMIQKVKSQHMC